jgi:hypothetical protein
MIEYIMAAAAVTSMAGSLYGGQQAAAIGHAKADYMQDAADTNYGLSAKQARLMRNRGLQYAADLRKQGDLEALNIRSRGRAEIGEMTAQFGASGAVVGVGSPRDVLMAQTHRMETNAMNVLNAANSASQRSINDLMQDINLFMSSAEAAKRQAYNQASIVRAGGEAAKIGSAFDALGYAFQAGGYGYRGYKKNNPPPRLTIPQNITGPVDK